MDGAVGNGMHDAISFGFESVFRIEPRSLAVVVLSFLGFWLEQASFQIERVRSEL